MASSPEGLRFARQTRMRCVSARRGSAAVERPVAKSGEVVVLLVAGGDPENSADAEVGKYLSADAVAVGAQLLTLSRLGVAGGPFLFPQDVDRVVVGEVHASPLPPPQVHHSTAPLVGDRPERFF